MLSIVEFSDFEHIEGIVYQEGTAENMDACKTGQVADKFENNFLEEINQARSKDSPTVYGTIVAAAISHETNANNALVDVRRNQIYQEK